MEVDGDSGAEAPVDEVDGDGGCPRPRRARRLPPTRGFITLLLVAVQGGLWDGHFRRNAAFSDGSIHRNSLYAAVLCEWVLVGSLDGLSTEARVMSEKAVKLFRGNAKALVIYQVVELIIFEVAPMLLANTERGHVYQASHGLHGIRHIIIHLGVAPASH